MVCVSFCFLTTFTISTRGKDKKRGVWLPLSLKQAGFFAVAAELNFTFHHARDTKSMLTLWLPDTVCVCSRVFSFQLLIFYLFSSSSQPFFKSDSDEKDYNALPLFAHTSVGLYLLLLLLFAHIAVCLHRCWRDGYQFQTAGFGFAGALRLDKKLLEASRLAAVVIVSPASFSSFIFLVLGVRRFD